MKRLIIKLTTIVVIAVVSTLISQSTISAPLTLTITRWVEDAYPIAVVPFGLEGKRKPKTDVAGIISSDLIRSGKFNPLPEKDMLSKPTKVESIKFKNWRVLGAESLVIGKLVHKGGDKYTIKFWLFDVFKAKQLDAYSIDSSESNLRTAAHRISDLIYKKIVGEPGAFSTYIAYVTAERQEKETEYTLWISDSDGENPHTLLRSKQPIMSPSWAPGGKRIAYASLEDGGAQKVIIQNRRSGERDVVTTIKKGLYGAPAWSPNGKQLAFTISHRGNADIYRLDLKTKKSKRITNHWAIDTEAVWTPDGKSLIFTSDRSGRPQVYRVSSNGGQVERLTFEGKENARPSVSPDGKWLAMVHRVDGEFKIAVMNLQNNSVQVLTDGILDESPSFAPNGSMIIYATTTGSRGTLATVSTDGRFRQSLAYKGDVREPAWSPLNVR